MTATATLSVSEEGLPNFDGLGRSAGAFGTILTRQTGTSSAGLSPGATGADNVIASYALPANTFNYAPQGNALPLVNVATAGLRVRIIGHFAANGNTKTVKLIYNPATATVGSTVGTGGTTLITTSTLTTSGGGFILEGWIAKYGAPNSNTQVAGQYIAYNGTTLITLPAPSYVAAVENAAINIAVTGNAATTATDIVVDLFEIWGYN
jgi:hypothetical protein